MALRDNPPPRPEVTLAVLRSEGDHGHQLELTIARSDDSCELEVLNLAHDPAAEWSGAVRVRASSEALVEHVGADWARLTLSKTLVQALGVEPGHALLIRQVGPDGAASMQSLFRVSPPTQM